jgi:hypothetical protein
MIVLRFPDSSREFWATNEMFAVGDVVQHNGPEWEVAKVDEYPALGTVVTVAQAAERDVAL